VSSKRGAPTSLLGQRTAPKPARLRSALSRGALELHLLEQVRQLIAVLHERAACQSGGFFRAFLRRSADRRWPIGRLEPHAKCPASNINVDADTFRTREEVLGGWLEQGRVGSTHDNLESWPPELGGVNRAPRAVEPRASFWRSRSSKFRSTPSRCRGARPDFARTATRHRQLARDQRTPIHSRWRAQSSASAGCRRT
jgi:hypothetical protein